MSTMIWAHRGASAYAPENTMKAFIMAQRMGAEGIELDVHRTKDNILVVAHDETVDRCSNGTGRIVDMTYKELMNLDFSNKKEKYSDVRLPTLEQVLEFAKSTGLHVNIEIKSGIVIYDRIEDDIVKLVSVQGMKDYVIYSSFNHYSLTILKRLDPSARIGILYNEAMVDPFIYAKHINADAIHPYYPTLMVPGTVSNCKKHGIKIHPWTVDDRDHIAWMLKEDVDAIITNRPDEAVKLRNLVQHSVNLVR